MIYLDNAATSYPKPKQVYDFMHKFYQNHGGSPGRSGHDLALESDEIVYETRKLLTDFFNGENPNHLTFSYNASDSLNMVIGGLMSQGDHVITTTLEHNSVLRPLYHKEMDGIIEVTYVPFDSKGYIDPDDIKKAIKSNTKTVIVNHGSNVIGTVQPISEIGKICRELGIYFIVDASQTAGTQKIDVQEMNIDVLVFTGHKSLMGPTGIGGSYIREGVPIRVTRFGGTGVNSAQRTHLEECPYRFECGTLNIVGVSGLYEGQRWIRKKGLAKIHQSEIALWDRLRKGLQNIDGVVTYCADGIENRNPVLSFNVKGWEALDVGSFLDVDYNIACRTGLQCAPLVHEQLGTHKIFGTVRLSLGPFNTIKDIDTAVEAVREISKMRKSKTF